MKKVNRRFISKLEKWLDRIFRDIIGLDFKFIKISKKEALVEIHIYETEENYVELWAKNISTFWGFEKTMNVLFSDLFWSLPLKYKLAIKDDESFERMFELGEDLMKLSDTELRLFLFMN